ncbi:MAG: polysulfide reductase NrfD [Coriobacteriales bacterium]|jgi:formate-dependent nitrite reductase membrane component NrfD|nr:polysulfide reductase NrfD [Coriobacteriales bacterium]
MEFEPIWGAIIAWYLFLAGVGGGAYVFAALLGWLFPTLKKMRRYALIMVPVVVIVGLLLLIVDAEGGLKNPLRFVLLLTNFGSVMTWGVVFLSGFVLIALIALLLDLKGRPLPRWLDVLGVVLALSVALYTGALLGVAKTFPLWNTALLPILFLVSALSAGGAAILLAGALFAPEELAQIKSLKKAHYVLPLIELVLLASLLFITFHNSTAGAASVLSLVCGRYALAFWVGLVGLGLVLHVLVETKLLFFSSEAVEESATARYLGVATGAFVLVGGFLLRLLIVVAALPLSIVA